MCGDDFPGNVKFMPILDIRTNLVTNGDMFWLHMIWRGLTICEFRFFQSVYFSNLVSSPDMKTGLNTAHDQVSEPDVDE